MATGHMERGLRRLSPHALFAPATSDVDGGFSGQGDHRGLAEPERNRIAVLVGQVDRIPAGIDEVADGMWLVSSQRGQGTVGVVDHEGVAPVGMAV